MVPESHAHRGLTMSGTLLSGKKALKPIFPVRSWTRSALLAFETPAWSLRVAGVGSWVRWNRWRPLVLALQRDVQACLSTGLTREWTAVRNLVCGFAYGLIAVAVAFASLSACSFPSMSWCLSPEIAFP
jgi:hypothetical protein